MNWFPYLLMALWGLTIVSALHDSGKEPYYKLQDPSNAFWVAVISSLLMVGEAFYVGWL